MQCGVLQINFRGLPYKKSFVTEKGTDIPPTLHRTNEMWSIGGILMAHHPIKIVGPMRGQCHKTPKNEKFSEKNLPFISYENRL